MAIGGVAGPAAFIGAWVTGAARTAGYSPINDAISRLAAVHAPTRVLMTGGFVGLTLGVGAFAVALKDRLPGNAWLAAATTASATLAVAALPLDHSPTVDLLHGAAATIGYISLASTPFLAAKPLASLGYARIANASRAVAGFSALCLAGTVAGPAHGLLQRSGLTASDAWIVLCALAMLGGKLPSA